MCFGIKVPGTPCGTSGCRWDVNKTFPPTHETAPLFLCKHVILVTHSYWACPRSMGSRGPTWGILVRLESRWISGENV